MPVNEHPLSACGLLTTIRFRWNTQSTVKLASRPNTSIFQFALIVQPVIMAVPASGSCVRNAAEESAFSIWHRELGAAGIVQNLPIPARVKMSHPAYGASSGKLNAGLPVTLESGTNGKSRRECTRRHLTGCVHRSLKSSTRRIGRLWQARCSFLDRHDLRQSLGSVRFGDGHRHRREFSRLLFRMMVLRICLRKL